MSKLKNNKNIKKYKKDDKNVINNNENIINNIENIINDNENIINNDNTSTNVIDNKQIFIVNNNVKNKQYIDDELFDINYNFLNINKNNDDNIEKKTVTVKKTVKKTVKSSKKSSSTHSSYVNSFNSLSSSNNNKDLYKKIEDKNIFFNELLKKQIVGIPTDKKLNYNDIKRISKFITSSVFEKKKCSLWNGYITNENNNSKGTYINFYFNKKKIALHRLLYINYIGDLSDNEYLKFSCENKGKCCNIHHMKKYTYSNKNNQLQLKNSGENQDKKKSQNNDLCEPVQINIDKKKLIVEI
jgi:hypothetical protein